MSVSNKKWLRLQSHSIGTKTFSMILNLFKSNVYELTVGDGRQTGTMCCLNFTFLSSLTKATSFLKSDGE